MAQPQPIDPPQPVETLDEMWYLRGEESALGPFSAAVLEELIAEGAIGSGTAIAKVGSTRWTLISQVPAFSDRFQSSEELPGRVAKHAYAGFRVRLDAFLLDTIIFFLVAAVAIGLAILAVFLLTHVLGGDITSIASMPVVAALGAVIEVLYVAYFLSGPWQATPGKRIRGIHVMRADGGRITPLRAFLRLCASILSAFPLGLGFLMIVWTREHRALHDILCGTRVVYGKL